jgi:hypothetical protein
MKKSKNALKETAKIYVITNKNFVPNGMKFNSDNLNPEDFECLTIPTSQFKTLANIVGTNKEVNLDYDSPK